MIIREEEIQSIEDLLAYILEFEDVIFVREKIGEKWDSVALKDLEIKTKARHIWRFLDDGRIPVRLKRDGEMS